MENMFISSFIKLFFVVTKGKTIYEASIDIF